MADDAERRELSLRAMFTPVLIRLKLTHGVTRAGGHEFFKSPCRKRESGPTRGRPGLATAWGPYFDAMFLGVDAQIVIDVGGQTVRYDLTAGRGAWYLQPPTRFTPFPMLVRAIAKRESRDVAANLRALATIKNTCEKLDKSYL